MPTGGVIFAVATPTWQRAVPGLIGSGIKCSRSAAEAASRISFAAPSAMPAISAIFSGCQSWSLIPRRWNLYSIPLPKLASCPRPTQSQQSDVILLHHTHTRETFGKMRRVAVAIAGFIFWMGETAGLEATHGCPTDPVTVCTTVEFRFPMWAHSSNPYNASDLFSATVTAPDHEDSFRVYAFAFNKSVLGLRVESRPASPLKVSLF